MLTACPVLLPFHSPAQIARVHYPGLASHPDHAAAARQMSGFGGVVSFEVAGDLWATAKLVDSLRLPYIAPSLGGVESLVEQPAVIWCACAGGGSCRWRVGCDAGRGQIEL